MSDFRTAAQQALEALELAQTDVYWELNSPTRKFLRKAEKNLRAALAEPVQEPVAVDQRVVPLVESALQAVAEKIGDQCAVWYGVGARDVEEVLREAVRHGLVHGALAEPAIDPVDEYRKGFIAGQIDMRDRLEEQQEPVEPVAKVELMMTGGNAGLATRIVEIDDHLRDRLRPGQILYTAPPQRKPLTVMELQDALVYTNLIDPDAVNDPEGYDEGSTLALIDALHQRLTGDDHPCNPHPKAPHSFMRNASHTEDRYVCECEGWEPYEAGYQAGMEAALRAQS